MLQAVIADCFVAHAGGGGKRDLSPPRKRIRASADPVNALSGPGPAASRKPRFMPDGSRAGQVTGSELAAELKVKAQRDAKQFAELGAQLTGRGADTVSTTGLHDARAS